VEAVENMLSIWLIGLHMLGDYILQTDRMAAKKLIDWRVRTEHVFMYTYPFYFFCLVREYLRGGYILCLSHRHYMILGFAGSLFITHWITDCRRWASGDKWCAKPIMVDQTIHILTLAILGSIFLTQ
jgi:Protein of unknown function (DUF3307)